MHARLDYALCMTPDICGRGMGVLFSVYLVSPVLILS
jgi:hypothetical protein